MSSRGQDQPRIPPELSPVTLGLAAVASAAATVTVSRFGLAGTVLGAALAPVVVAVVRELGRRPVERVVRVPTGTRAIVRRGPRVRPRVVAITAGVAFLAVVAFFTVPDLIRGSSVVSERPSTFFSRGDGSGSQGAPATTTTTDQEPVEAPPEQEPATTAPEEPATTDAPAVTAPQEAPVPAQTAPVPAPPPG